MDHVLPFVYNFPSFSILMTLMAGMVTPFIRGSGRVAQKINFGVIVVVGAMNAILLGTLLSHDGGTSYTYMMGHFPAPWGNELRAGPLEALLATLFCLVMALSILGGLRDIYNDIRPKKQYLYFLMLNLLLSSLLALIYTNDLFTAYVFIEINTIAACAIVMIKDSGETIVATIRYLIMSLLGSGLFLFGVCILYNITGQLLLSSIQEALIPIFQTGQYAIPLTVVIGLMVLGVALLAARRPRFFHHQFFGNFVRSGSERLLDSVDQDGLPDVHTGNALRTPCDRRNPDLRYCRYDYRFRKGIEGKAHQAYDCLLLRCTDRLHLYGYRSRFRYWYFGSLLSYFGARLYQADAVLRCR